MNVEKIAVKSRTENGKGPARRLRKAGNIPAVAYGKSLPSTPLTLSPKDLIAALSGEHGRNTVLELDVDGKDKLKVLLVEFQTHPVTRNMLHADFVQIKDDEDVDVEIPLELVGKPVGVIAGGVLHQVFRRLPVRCRPANIPVKIVHDVTELGLDEQIKVSGLAVPEGVTVRLKSERTIISVAAGRAGKDDEEAKPEEGAAEEAKPAEGAAAPEEPKKS